MSNSAELEIHEFKRRIYDYNFSQTAIKKEIQLEIEKMLNMVLYKITYPISNWLINLPALIEFYQFIREVRVYYSRDLCYLFILTFYEYNKTWATQSIIEMANSYGSWKDIKYFCNYCKHKTGTTTHPLILFSISILEQRLKMDWMLYLQGKDKYISYAAKWTPREKTKYNWIYSILAISYFGYMNSCTKESYKKAFTKSKMELRRILSAINRKLKTVEIHMCNNSWNKINLETTPIYAIFKYYKALCRHNVNIGNLSSSSSSRENYYGSRKISYTYLYNITARLIEHNSINKKIYTSYLNNLVKRFCIQDYYQTLSVIDATNITPILLKSAICFSAMHSDCVFIIEPSGNYLFLSLKNKSLTYTEKTTMITEKINIDNYENENEKENEKEPRNKKYPLETDTKCSLLKSGLEFLDICYKDANITNSSDLERLLYILYSSKKRKELEEILKVSGLKYIIDQNNLTNEFNQPNQNYICSVMM